jgi:hypothetical protein
MNRRRNLSCLQLADEVKARWHTSVLTLQESDKTLADKVKVFLQSGEGSKQLIIAKDVIRLMHILTCGCNNLCTFNIAGFT